MLKHHPRCVGPPEIIEIFIKIEFSPNIHKALIFHQNHTVVDQEKTQLQKGYFIIFFQPIVDEMSAYDGSDELQPRFDDCSQVVNMLDIS